ncbi:MAG: hypothetical protein WC821_02005 [archaeon]
MIHKEKIVKSQLALGEKKAPRAKIAQKQKEQAKLGKGKVILEVWLAS